MLINLQRGSCALRRLISYISNPLSVKLTSILILSVNPPGSKLGLAMHVFGPETHMTAIVGMALGQRAVPKDRVEPLPITLLGAKNVRRL